MAFPTAAEIRARFNFSLKDSTDDSPINFAGENAANDLEDWLKTEDFAMAENSNAPADPAQLKRYKRIRNAYMFLAVYYVFLTNTQIRSGGSVKSEADGDERLINYYTPKEQKEMREQYLEQAKNLIASFAKINLAGVTETITEMEVAAAHPAELINKCSLNYTLS